MVSDRQQRGSLEALWEALVVLRDARGRGWRGYHLLSPAVEMPAAYRTSKAIAATATLKGICARALALLRRTLPNGAAFARGVQQALKREQVWVQWKSEKCQGYERFAELDEEESATLNKKDTRAMMIAITKAKRKAVVGGDGSAGPCRLRR